MSASSLARHRAGRDVDRRLLHGGVERGDERHAELGGLHRVVAHVVAVVEVLDDVGARGLGAQPELLHLLDEPALAVAARRLRLLGLRAQVEHLERLARLQRRQRAVALGGVLLVDLEVPERRDAAAVRHERLAAQPEVDALALDDGRRQQRGEEAPGDQVVDLGLVAAQLLLGRAHRVDRRVVGGALLAARRRELVLAGEPGRGGGDRLPVRELLQAAAQVERRRVHGVVGARVADEAVEVQRLGGAHGARRRHAGAGGGAHERRGVERRRRLVLARLGLVAGDLGELHAGAVEGGLHGLLGVEAALGVRHLERLAVALERRLDLPVRHRHEGAPLELAVDDEAQRGRLHAAHGQVVGAVAVRRERHEAREHRAPDEVDVLARVRRLGEVEVDGGGLVERGLDLLRRERRVAHADVPVHHGRRQHGLDVRVAVDRLGRRRLGARLGGRVLGGALARFFFSGLSPGLCLSASPRRISSASWPMSSPSRS